MISDVVIAGAGIGGLTLAIALRRRGVRVICLERASELRPAGAGIALPPNGVKGLAQLGLERDLLAAGRAITRAAILDQQGRVLGSETDATQVYHHVGAPIIALHRARLHALLLKAAGPGAVRTNTAVVSYASHDNRIIVTAVDGAHFETELLIGADGLHSAVRKQLVGDEAPLYSGYTSWRGVTPAGSVAPPARMSESWGWGQRFGIVDIGFGEIYWFACANASPGGRDRDVQAGLMQRFAGWHEPIAQLIRATPPERILRTDICDRPPLERWHADRVVLLGDAAHPMTPNLGQGAGQAIEDAITLDRCLSETNELETALRLFEQHRVARANAIALMSRRVGRIAQWRNPVAVWLRNTGMRLVPAWFRDAQARKLV